MDRGEGGGRHFRDEEEEKTLGFRSLRGERGKGKRAIWFSGNVGFIAHQRRGY